MYKKLNKIILQELKLIDKAEDLAQQLHMGQKRRNGNPYIIHPKRIQLLAKELGYGEDIQIASLLHDILEDSKEEYINKIIEYIKRVFGQDILNIIVLLTHEHNIDYNVYLYKLISSNSKSAIKAFQVKLLDIYDNLQDNPTKKQYKKYYDAIQYLINNGMDKNIIPIQIYKLFKQKNILEDNKSTDPNIDSDTQDIGSDDINDIKSEDEIDMKDGSNDSMDNEKDDEKGNDEDVADSDKDITKYNGKVNKIQGIKSQNNELEPEFDFNNDNFYNKKYTGTTSKGSLIIGTPKIIDNQSKDLNFLKDNIIPKIDFTINLAKSNNQKIILLGDVDYPYQNGKYKNNEQGIIGKYLMKKYNNVGFDYWAHKNYADFKSDVKINKELEQRTKAQKSEIYATLYLYNILYNGRNEKYELHDGIISKLNEWNITESDLNNSKKIINFLYPEINSNLQNKSSFILKSYLHLMESNLMKKVISYEKKGDIVIVPTNKNIAWKLSSSFKNIYNKSTNIPKNKENKK